MIGYGKVGPQRGRSWIDVQAICYGALIDAVILTGSVKKTKLESPVPRCGLQSSPDTDLTETIECNVAGGVSILNHAQLSKSNTEISHATSLEENTDTTVLLVNSVAIKTSWSKLSASLEQIAEVPYFSQEVVGDHSKRSSFFGLMHQMLCNWGALTVTLLKSVIPVEILLP